MSMPLPNSKNRKQTRRPRKFSRYLVWSLSFLIFPALIAVISLPLFQIQKINVQGTRLLDKDEVSRRAQTALGQNILLVNIDNIHRGIKDIPLVKEARVKRLFPNSLLIEIIERQEAAVGIVGEKAVMFDEEGYILNLKEVASSQPDFLSFTNLPVIVGIKPNEIKEGKLTSDLGKLLRSVLKDCREHFTADKIKIDFSLKDDIVLLVDDFINVKIGEAGEVNKKIKVFEVLRDFEQSRLQSVEYIDVGAPENPVVKFKT